MPLDRCCAMVPSIVDRAPSSRAGLVAGRPNDGQAMAKPVIFTALDLLPDNHPDVDPGSVYLQITALREAEHAMA